ncbi:ubiquinone biosynthesis protein [Gracilibacillus orientalis]|uniref:Ubiquinone biosynthesis protein n=1 Tax=Gracilibacillus orientalis TaxID=334253 RepID=A0A1I4R6J7_9BACI|nr:AarF/UbiB family protein [Gracilibacillus orientalis]SFM47849.1 ubiquinone biosynthesis protein [Gracilibacillus orientalis]
MFFLSVLIVCFIIFILLASLFNSNHKVIVSLVGALVVSVLVQVLEQFYLSSIIIAAFIFYFIIANIKVFKNEQLKLMVAVLFSTSTVTLVLTFTYFNQISNISDRDEILRVMFIYYPLSIIFIACYTYMLLCLFNFKVLQTPNPLLYIVNKIRGFMRMVQLLWIASRKGLNHLIQQDHAKLPNVIAEILDDMGGIFVKFAQVLSTKKDILPSNYIDAFSSLHDQVQPLRTNELKTIIDNKIGNIDDIYKSFDMRPIAAASIGQVHLATLKLTGEKVVVKILRPNVKQKMTVDLDLLIQFVSWLSERSSKIKRLGLIELAKGFKKNLVEETDFDIEALNTNLLKKAFKEHDINIRVPKIYSEYSNKHVLTMEYMEGDSFTKEVTADVSEMIMHAFLEQILMIGIFHADPHPGNIMLTKGGEIALIDFGSVGYLTDDERDGMLSFLVGYSNNDTKEMVHGLRKVCEGGGLLDEVMVERRLNRLLSEASFSHDPTSVMMKRLMSMITEMGLSLKPTVAGAFRAIVTLDGTLSSVDEEYSLTTASESYASHIDKGQLAEKRISKIQGQLEDYIPKLLELPILKDDKITIVHEKDHQLNDLIGILTVSIFTVICMVVMLTSFFVQGELIRFLLAPLSMSGFGVGMIILIMSVIKHLKPKI